MFHLEDKIEDVAEEESDDNHQKQDVDILGLEPEKDIIYYVVSEENQTSYTWRCSRCKR